MCAGVMSGGNYHRKPEPGVHRRVENPPQKFCPSEAKPLVEGCESTRIISPAWGKGQSLGRAAPRSREPSHAGRASLLGADPRELPVPRLCRVQSPASSPAPKHGRPRWGAAGCLARRQLPRERRPTGDPRPPWRREGPAGISALLLSFQGRVNCQSCKEETYSLLTIFNLKMQMLLVSRSLIRVPLCHALTSIRGDYENVSTLAFSKCHYDSTCCTNAWLSH